MKITMKLWLALLSIFALNAISIFAQSVWVTGSVRVNQYNDLGYILPKWLWDREWVAIQTKTNFFTQSTGTLPQPTWLDPYRWRDQNWWSRIDPGFDFSPRGGYKLKLYKNGGILTNATIPPTQMNLTRGLYGDVGKEDYIEAGIKRSTVAKAVWTIDNSLGLDPRVIVFTYSHRDSDEVEHFLTNRVYVGAGATVNFQTTPSGGVKMLRFRGYGVEVPFRAGEKY